MTSKDLIIEAFKDTEVWGLDYLIGIEKAERQRLLAAGMEWLPWSKSEREYFSKTFMDALWKELEEVTLKDQPAIVKKLKDMLKSPTGSTFTPTWEPD